LAILHKSRNVPVHRAFLRTEPTSVKQARLIENKVRINLHLYPASEVELLK